MFMRVHKHAVKQLTVALATDMINNSYNTGIVQTKYTRAYLAAHYITYCWSTINQTLMCLQTGATDWLPSKQ